MTVAAEVSFMWRKIGQAAKPNIDISVDGDRWSIKSVTTFFTSETSFELGKEFEDTTPDGRKVMVSVMDVGRLLYVGAITLLEGASGTDTSVGML